MKQKRIAITAQEMEAGYRLCLERERERERKWKLTKQGAFESSIVHFDMEAEGYNEFAKGTAWYSDGGYGARVIRNACDLRPDPCVKRRRQIDRAKHRIARNAPECLSVFWLVLKNGNNRKESIWQLMKPTSKERPNGGRHEPSIGTR